MMCLFVAMSSTQSYASHAEAWSAIDWQSVDITFTGTGSYGNTYIETNAMADQELGNNSGSTSEPVESYEEIDSDYFWGWGLYDQDDLYADAYIEGYNGTSYGDAGFYGQYTADTAGTLTISFDYYLAYDVMADSGDYVYADAFAEIYICGLNDSDDYFIEAINGMNFLSETPVKNMSLSLDLVEGQIVDFSVLTGAEAGLSPVPIPGAFWLLSSGFVGIASLRKRLKRK